MPRRRRADALSSAVGTRIRRLREEAGLTLEKLAYESELGSKGHLSNLERGLVRPTVHTLKSLADRLGVRLLDLVCFPDEDDTQRVVDSLRELPSGTVRKLLRELERRRPASGPKGRRRRTP